MVYELDFFFERKEKLSFQKTNEQKLIDFLSYFEMQNNLFLTLLDTVKNQLMRGVTPSVSISW
jgi:hypothetical protein